MPPKNKKTKAEEALDFLSNLDNLDDTPPAAAAPKETNKATSSTPRQSTDSSRPRTEPAATNEPRKSSEHTGTPKTDPAEDEEAAKALAFLEAQINTKRQPLSVPQSSRPATPQASAAVKEQEKKVELQEPVASASTAAGGGWGSSWWSSASSALQSAQKIADEQYKKVKTEGVGGVTGQLEHLNVKGVDLAKLRKEAEERLGGIVKNVDLEKLRQDLYNNTSSALNNIINTVAPPISAHETLELWLSHPMTGYAGVEGVVYRAWLAILDQTESGELVIVWSPPESATGTERAINQVDGFEKGWEIASGEIKSTKAREENDPKGRKQNGITPVTTVPIFLHLQPVHAPLVIPEPQLLLDSTSAPSKPKHLHFILTLQDPTHNLQFTTISQSVPGDWLEVEYDQSEWVEERLVDVIRVGVETIAQDYVATRMALKPSAKTQTRPATPRNDVGEVKTAETVSSAIETGDKKDD